MVISSDCDRAEPLLLLLVGDEDEGAEVAIAEGCRLDGDGANETSPAYKAHVTTEALAAAAAPPAGLPTALAAPLPLLLLLPVAVAVAVANLL